MKAKAERKTANALYMMVVGFERYDYKIVNAIGMCPCIAATK